MNMHIVLNIRFISGVRVGWELNKYRTIKNKQISFDQSKYML